jgi:hypothetical protein
VNWLARVNMAKWVRDRWSLARELVIGRSLRALIAGGRRRKRRGRRGGRNIG